MKVNEVVPTVNPGPDLTINEGESFGRGGAYFSDPSGYTWTATVDYGDGSGVQPLTLNADKTFSLGHTYASHGSYTVTVVVTDDEGTSGTGTFTVTVNNLPPAVTAPADQSASEGTSQAFNLGSFTDPGQDNPWVVDVDWGDGSAHTTFNANSAGQLAGQAHAYQDEGSYTVTVTVTDNGGLAATGTFKVTVNDVLPTVSAGGNLTLNEGSPFSRSGSFTDPGADTWTATVDYGDGSGPQPLALNADKSFSLGHAYATPGSYKVTVVVTDDDNTSGTGTFTVTVNNVAPTVTAPANQTAQESTAQSIALGSFTDPGSDSPWAVTVAWGDGGSTNFSTGAKGSLGSLNHAYASAGTYTVTVTVTDAYGGSGSGSFQVAVANVPPTVALTTAPASGARGQSRYFAGSFTDPGTADTWTATVNYGDGSGTQPLALNPDKTFAFSYTYTASGTYTVTVTVTDKDGGTGSAGKAITIRAVDVQPDSLNPGRTALVVGGTTASDTITFNPGSSAGQYTVTINGVSQGTFTAPAGAPFSRIIAFGQAGDDTITVSSKITLPAWLYGGAGNDHLTGGSGPDVLLGGDGNDSLTGGSNRDLLIGGAGADTLYGVSNDDILIAGTTSFDANEAALNAIMQEWTSSHSYSVRVNNLTNGSGSSDRLNGNYFLVKGQTVFDDLDVDTLETSSGQDWLFYDPTRDKVKHK